MAIACSAATVLPCVTAMLWSHTGLPQEPFLPASKELPTPAVIDGFLMSRRSVREFKDRPIAKETLGGAAGRGPAGSDGVKLPEAALDCRERWGKGSRIVCGGDELAAHCRTSVLPGWSNGKVGYDFILRGAPTVIMACTPADYRWGKQDCAIALTFLELAAEARGLGVCWAGYLTRVAGVHAPLRQALSVPEGYVVHGGLMLGEHKYSYRRVPPRKPLSVQWI